MSQKLSDANPYLRDPAVRERMVIRSVVTSSAIDGIRVSSQRSHRSSGQAPARPTRFRGNRG